MTLNDILLSAQDGKAVGNLAQRFGLTSVQAEAATQAMIPAFSAALERLRDNPAALGGLIVELAAGGHGASNVEGAADDLAGAQAAAKVFGSPEAVGKVVAHAAEASGVAPGTIGAMLPAVASILIGGLAHAMASQGFSGVLGDLASAASSPGGLDSALGSSGGGVRGMLSSIFGGGRRPADPQAAARVAGLAALSGMFVAGIAASQAAQASLNAIAGSMTQPPTPT